MPCAKPLDSGREKRIIELRHKEAAGLRTRKEYRVNPRINPLWILLYGWGGGFAGPHSDRTDHIAKHAKDFFYHKETT